MTSPKPPKTNAKTKADDHDPSEIAQKQDKQKPQWLQAEDRSEVEENLKPTNAEKNDDNPPDA